MNDNSREKERLINQILTIYDQINLYKYDLNSNSGVLTNKCIPMIWSIYNNTNSLYSFIFGDFNKLGELNKKYGKEQMNIAINTALGIISDCLPTDAIISKYTSGDEYCIILPDKKQSQSQEYLEDIYRELNISRETLLGLSMTFDVEDNTEIKNIFELFKKTATAVSQIKAKNNSISFGRKKNKQLEQNDDIMWQELNKKIIKATKNFIADLRFENDLEITKNNLRQIMLDYEKNTIEALNYNYDNENIEMLNPYEDKLLDQEQAKHIYENLFNRKDMLEYLLNSDIEVLDIIYNQSKEIFEQLTKDHISGLYSKSIFRRQVIPTLTKNKNKYQIIYFSLSGIKLMNKAYNYNYTDMLIKHRADELVDLINNKTKICDNIFVNMEPSETIFVDQGGGNYSVFVPKTKDISEQYINDMVSKINMEDGLEVVYSFSDDLKKGSPNAIITQTRELRDECIKKKSKIKTKRLLNRDNNIKLAFIHELKDAVEYFRENVATNEQTIAKKVFIKNVISALLEEINECRPKKITKSKVQERKLK